MSQEKFFSNNSESESEYEDSELESEYEDSEDSDRHSPKRRKIDGSTVTEEVLLTDATGHIKWHRGQRLGAFEIESELGEGAFGRVLRVKNVKTRLTAALKVTKNEQKRRHNAMAEIIALTMIECRDPEDTSFCIKMLRWFSCAGHVCIAFPLLGISVFDFLEKNDFEPFTIREVRHISYQLCVAVSFLHRNGMTHTDLKPENMLFVDARSTTVFSDKSATGVRRLYSTEIRLSDFGCVTRHQGAQQTTITTHYYRAPEVTLGLGWTNSCDIWSIGCIIFELYMGHLLFPTKEVRQQLGMMEKILGEFPAEMVHKSKTTHFKNGKLDYDWSQAETDVREHCQPLIEFRLEDNKDDNQLFNLIQQMMPYEPTQRISASTALVQPFLEKLSSKQQ